ncbi:uncharacterized protein LOC144107091 [Amblyomma americanum]
MPGPGQQKMHRLHGHVAGVNWRPTLFAEDVPHLHVCDLCQMIPKSTVLLPCSHLLCELCHRAIAQTGSTICPLDREPFAEDECHIIPVPNRKANSLKVHCWNSTQGCEFIGTMEAVLRHYEDNCTFHALECPRCGMSVLHKDLPDHYLTGCLVNSSLTVTEHVSSQDNVLTIQDVSRALRELKTLLRDPYREFLPSFQSQINELAECVKHQSAQIQEIERKLEQSEQSLKEEMNGIAGNMSMTIKADLRCQQDAFTSVLQRSLATTEPVAAADARATQISLPWCHEKQLILRKLELFVHQASMSIEELRQCVKHNVRRATAFCKRVGPSFCHVMDNALSMPHQGREDSVVEVSYLLTITNADVLFESSGPLRKFATVIQWHRRDTYFILYLLAGKSRGDDQLCLSLKCGGFLETSCLSSAAFTMTVMHGEESKNLVMRKFLLGSPFLGHRFLTNLSDLKSGGFVTAGELKIVVVISEGRGCQE